jgi:Putative peptidoglycan binding domain
LRRDQIGSGTHDGEFGPITRNAIREFQQSLGASASGFLSSDQRSALLESPQVRDAVAARAAADGVIAGTGTGRADQWTLVKCSDPTLCTYASPPSIATTENDRMIHIMVNFAAPAPFGDTGKEFGSLVQWVKFDCTAPRWQLGPSTLYAGKDGSGEVLDQGDDWTEWFSVPPLAHETMPEVRNMACPTSSSVTAPSKMLPSVPPPDGTVIHDRTNYDFCLRSNGYLGTPPGRTHFPIHILLACSSFDPPPDSRAAPREPSCGSFYPRSFCTLQDCVTFLSTHRATSPDGTGVNAPGYTYVQYCATKKDESGEWQIIREGEK